MSASAPAAPKIQIQEAKTMVSMENVTKVFGSFTTLSDLSFQIKEGEILGFLGPNGAGKTTAMRILAGYFPPTSGKVFVNGLDVYEDREKAKRHIGYLPESVNLYHDMTIYEMLKFVAAIKQVPKKELKQHIEEILFQCGLWEMRNRLIGQLSKGYKQRTGLAQALINNPQVLILDEPTSGLDPEQINKIRELIHDLGAKRTIILSTHILPEVSMVCDRVLILNEGKIAASGTVEELEAGLQAPHQVLVTVGERHRKNEIEKMFESIKQVVGVTLMEEKGDHVTFRLSVAKDSEVRPDINKICVEKHVPLLEIRAMKLSLEEIFLKLIIKEQQGSS